MKEKLLKKIKEKEIVVGLLAWDMSDCLWQ